MKILIIAGHGDGDPGAGGNGYWEANLTREALPKLAKNLRAFSGANVDTYPTGRNAYTDLKNGNPTYYFSEYDLVVELHFNAYNGRAYGTETLYRTSKTLAGKVSDAIARVGFFNRGPKLRTDLQNCNIAFSVGTPYILIETCFIDNKNDMALYKSVINTVWGNVADAIASCYGLEKTPSKMSLSGANYPTTLKKGQRFVIEGVVKSNAKLKSVVVVVEDKDGVDVKECTKRRYTSAKKYNLTNIDPYIAFRKLKVGTYRYKVKAEDINGTKKTLLNKEFKVTR